MKPLLYLFVSLLISIKENITHAYIKRNKGNQGLVTYAKMQEKNIYLGTHK